MVKRLLLPSVKSLSPISTASTTRCGILPLLSNVPASSRPLSASHSRPPRRLSPSHFSISSRSSSILTPPSLIHTPRPTTTNLRFSILAYRTMATTAAKNEFLCILPDKPGAQAKRIEVRPAHLEGIKPIVASGAVVAGGALLESHPAEGETPKFKGSMLIAMASSVEEVKEMISKDVYATSGVWDLDAAQIIPLKSAVRCAL